ncbi:hypothetical protein GGU11DRAFT_740916 [Lentinula aff. detonsa]|nr:hypothetical protein GGU11DRAFT_740916 [Lentinula aff. detonsa]
MTPRLANTSRAKGKRRVQVLNVGTSSNRLVSEPPTDDVPRPNESRQETSQLGSILPHEYHQLAVRPAFLPQWISSELGTTIAFFAHKLKLAQNAQKTVTKSTVDPPVDHIGWKHPAELIYSTGTHWTNKKLIYYCIANALSVNPPSLTMPGVCSVSGGKKTVVLSDRYRIPIIYASRWQWAKLKELMTAADEEQTLRWSEAKYEVLHIARVWKILTDERPSADTLYWCYPSWREQRLEDLKEWRCHTLDRVLTRFRMDCFSSEPSRVEKFWEEYQGSEYSKDVLEFGTGFSLDSAWTL